MVKISPLRLYLPSKPAEFCTKPYDVIDGDEEALLKQNPNSLIHLILPDGKGEEVYQNAAKAFAQLKENKAILRQTTPSLYVYRQESPAFSQEGLIFGAALQDYEDDNIVKHEHTRKKPLADRTKHISATQAATGLVWNVFRANPAINAVMEKIKTGKAKFDFEKEGYRNILWETSDSAIVKELTELFAADKIFIADGHHRAASAAAYRQAQLKELKEAGKEVDPEAPWQYLLNYVASDDQIRIFPYNRVVRKLPLSEEELLTKLGNIYTVTKVDAAFNPTKKHQVALCCKGTWYKLEVKATEFDSKRDSLDVAILQDKVLGPILGIDDPRASDNLFFVGGLTDPKDMEAYVTQKGNDLFINLYNVDIRDLEEIAENGGVMPPKSTWFDPKLLSGLVLHDLRD